MFPKANRLHTWNVIRGNTIVKSHKALMFYYLLFIFNFYGGGGCIDFGGHSFDWTLEVVVRFLRVKRDWKATRPPCPLFPKYI